MLRHVVRLAAVTFAVAAAGLVVSPSAEAATCGTASGVSVVVDFHQLGGGVQTYCDAVGAGKKYANVQFGDAGHSLTPVNGQSFVCRVDDKPASDSCQVTPPATAYWSLWWSDGTTGAWRYSSLGAWSLKVPAGGYVALSWQKGNAQAPPRVPLQSRASSAPTTHPTSQPTSHPYGTPSSSTPTSTAPSAPTSSPATDPTSKPTEKSGKKSGKHDRHQQQTTTSKQAKPHDHESQDQAVGPVGSVRPGDGSGGSGSGGLPGWVAPVVIVVLFAAGGTIAVVRRKTHGSA